VLALEPEGSLFADELARVSPRVVRACRASDGHGSWSLPGEGAFRLAVAPLGALEAVGSSEERGRLLGGVFNLLEPGGVFALDLQLPPATHGADGVSRLIAERRAGASRKLFWENRRFETGSDRLEHRLAVEELAGDGTVRKKRYRCVVLSLVGPQRFEREAAAAGFEAERLSGESLCGEAAVVQTGGAPTKDGPGKNAPAGGVNAGATDGISASAAAATLRQLWLLTRPQRCGEGTESASASASASAREAV
jgi:hypothetical protein